VQYQVKIEGQGLDIWTYGGDVDDVTLRSKTQVWTQGGGGFVSPQLGGYVSPPQVHSMTSQYKEVRLRCDDGSCRTLNAAGHVTCTHGDRVAFVYASTQGASNGPLVGIINHTERRWWSFDTNNLIQEPDFKRTIFMIVIGMALTAITLAHNDPWGNFFLLFIGVPLYIIIFVVLQKSRAAMFQARVNKALQREIAVICKAGDDAAIPQMRSRAPTLAAQVLRI
jgi:hypothetical protein